MTVVIIGAGIGGVTAALTLHAAGINRAHTDRALSSHRAAPRQSHDRAVHRDLESTRTRQRMALFNSDPRPIGSDSASDEVARQGPGGAARCNVLDDANCGVEEASMRGRVALDGIQRKDVAYLSDGLT